MFRTIKNRMDTNPVDNDSGIDHFVYAATTQRKITDLFPFKFKLTTGLNALSITRAITN